MLPEIDLASKGLTATGQYNIWLLRQLTITGMDKISLFATYYCDGSDCILSQTSMTQCKLKDELISNVKLHFKCTNVQYFTFSASYQ